jgi:hypothetical protein
MTTELIDSFGLFLLLAGFVVGLGAVTVIDFHGFLGRTSTYWTEATTRTHKITKPLIWLGLTLAIIGGSIFYRAVPLTGAPLIHLISILCMVLNGIFLTFRVSPFLCTREREGKSAELLPAEWQRKIFVSFIVSFILWWGNLAVLVRFVVEQ